MLKIRCESCSRLILCEAVKDDGKSFCAYDCRLNWVRAMRRFETGPKANAKSM
jgi:hypothetical protein